MMSEHGLCKGCDEQYTLSYAHIERLLSKPIMQDVDVIVPDDVYAERLAKCQGCSQLWQGETCLLCGCFVRVSAKFKRKSCPDLKNKQWDALTSN